MHNATTYIFYRKFKLQFLCSPSFLRNLELLSHSRGKFFTTGQTYSPVIVFTFTTRAILSDEGWTLMIRARSHFPPGKFSFSKNAIVSGSTFVCLCNVRRYSISHLSHIWFDIETTCFRLLRLDMSLSSFPSITVPLLYLPSRRRFGTGDLVSVQYLLDCH